MASKTIAAQRLSSTKIAEANAGLRMGFAEKSRVILGLWPGVARLNRYAKGDLL